MIMSMIGYALYVFLAVGLTVLLTAAFRHLRRDDQRIAPAKEDAAFDRRMAEIEAKYGLGAGPDKDGPDRS